MTKIHINLSNETKNSLKAAAASQGMSMTELVGDLIVQYLSEIRKEVA